MEAYAQLAGKANEERVPRDLTAVWERLTPLASATKEVRGRVESFCREKRISLEALEALGTRVALRGRGPEVELAFAGYGWVGGRRVPVAIRYRQLGSGQRRAEAQSVLCEPLTVGNRSALDWFIAEGETDTARLCGLVGDVAAVICLPGGALTFKREWAGLVPRGATVYLCHDADDAGDAGARKAKELFGGAAVRVRPPDGSSDWCEWAGSRDDFVKLVGAAKAHARTQVRTFDELLADYARERSGPEVEPVRLGFGSIDADLRGVSAGQVCGIAARTAVGKTWALASVSDNFAARQDSGQLIASLEMPGPACVERQLAIHADVAPEEVEQWARAGELGHHAADFLDRMRNARVLDESLALNDLPAALDEARARLEVPLRLLVVDYLGLLGAEGRDTYDRASTLGKGLKQLAKAEQVAIVVAMQLSRAGGDGSQPVSIDMLRDSGVLEESLDFLLGCWRPGKAPDLTPAEALDLRDVMRVAILKNRKGADGRIVDLHFRPDSRRLYEATEAA